MNNKRQRALEWWEGLKTYLDDKKPSKGQYMAVHYPNRETNSLTGFEIQGIWNVEKINRNNALIWWKTLSELDKAILSGGRTFMEDYEIEQQYDWVLSITPILK
jgi:hypothetical protein